MDCIPKMTIPRSIPPKHDECKQRIAKMRVKRDWFVKACSSSFCENNDEDLKVIDVTPF